jgi:AraC-like DNA-binding protein
LSEIWREREAVVKVLLHMPTPNPIRKEILRALNEHIIPSLWQQAVPLGYVAPPLEFPLGISARLIRKTVPRAERENVGFPLQMRWPKANLHSSFYPYLGFIYEGIADEHTLITAAQSAQLRLEKGVYAIRWQAPGVLLFPPGVAHNGGGSTFWEDAGAPSMKILWMSLWSELSIHTHIEDGAGQRYASHSLQINDSAILSLAALFMEELQNARLKEQSSAWALLLSMMLRLQKNLRLGHIKIANTSRSPVLSAETFSPGDRAGTVGREAAIFIQMHLHEPLSLPVVAEKVDLSTTHLNRIFRRVYGVPVMRYVLMQRIAASKKILEVGAENIEEISQLVGFKRANLFCRAFRKETGFTPGQYRRQLRHDKSTSDLSDDRN